MITIGKIYSPLKGAVNIRVDRKSVLGNPFYLNNEGQRDHVCDSYKHWLDNQIADKNIEVISMLYNIAELVRNNEHVHLQCWCAPKRCHAESIMHVIKEEFI